MSGNVARVAKQSSSPAATSGQGLLACLSKSCVLSCHCRGVLSPALPLICLVLLTDLAYASVAERGSAFSRGRSPVAHACCHVEAPKDPTPKPRSTMPHYREPRTRLSNHHHRLLPSPIPSLSPQSPHAARSSIPSTFGSGGASQRGAPLVSRSDLRSRDMISQAELGHIPAHPARIPGRCPPKEIKIWRRRGRRSIPVANCTEGGLSSWDGSENGDDTDSKRKGGRASKVYLPHSAQARWRNRPTTSSSMACSTYLIKRDGVPTLQCHARWCACHFWESRWCTWHMRDKLDGARAEGMAGECCGIEVGTMGAQATPIVRTRSACTPCWKSLSSSPSSSTA